MCNYMLAVPAVSCGLRVNDAYALGVRQVVFSESLHISVNLVRNLRENPFLPWRLRAKKWPCRE